MPMGGDIHGGFAHKVTDIVCGFAVIDAKDKKLVTVGDDDLPLVLEHGLKLAQPLDADGIVDIPGSAGAKVLLIGVPRKAGDVGKLLSLIHIW